MIARDPSTPPQTAARLAGNVRNAESRDRDELGRLFARTGVDAHALRAAASNPHGHVLVLEVDGALRGAVYVVIDSKGPRARIALLIVDPAAASVRNEVEERMIGVAMALCEAYACVEVEIGASPQEALAQRPRRVANG